MLKRSRKQKIKFFTCAVENPRVSRYALAMIDE